MNTSVFEKSLLEETLAEELFKTREPDLFQSGHVVLQPRDPPKDFAAFLQNEFGPEVLLQSFPTAKSLQVILCCLLWMVADPSKQERCWGSSVSMAKLMHGSLC